MFDDRRDAGRRLAKRLCTEPRDNLIVLGLPRGGVPVAFEVARELDVPLDVIVVRKIGVPSQPELAMGAIGEGGVRVVDDEVLRAAGVTARELRTVEHRERIELTRRAERFRRGRAGLSLRGRTALIVDDGIATGSTVRAACQVAREQGTARVIVAAPVAPPSALTAFHGVADEVIVLVAPEPFFAIGQFYRDFSQTSDDEVVRLLETASMRVPSTSGGRDEDVVVRHEDVELTGHLVVPGGTSSVVVFAHGSGSSRYSPRNLFVASMLNNAGLGTLLFDLLTPGEAAHRANVFDIALLARRLAGVTAWLREDARDVAIGYFGASTGAAAALWAAAEPGADIAAVVSRGGRPDLAAPRLGAVRAPTLLIVGGNDREVLQLNREAAVQMRCEKQLSVVPGATHLFEEPETLAAAAALARDWFVEHMTGAAEPGGAR